MKKTIKILIANLLAVSMVFFLISMTTNIQDEWVVPDEYKNMKNPMEGKTDVDNIGQNLWNKYCKSCHGVNGYGDGKMSAYLDTEMRNLTSDTVQAQNDGELYYKSFVGRDEMPNYEKKIPDDEDRWLLINYLRTLK